MKQDARASRAARLARTFISGETTAGMVLAFAAVLALIVANSPLSVHYNEFLEMTVTVALGSAGISKSMGHWINDGLMAVFFLLVGMEIKREALEGHLSTRDQVILPAMGALGGMVAPALIFILFTQSKPELMGGWAIPAATDIAFALGALALAGPRVPLALKVFLLTLATLDDLGAIVIIAIFYTSNLSVLALVLAAIVLAALFGLNRAGVTRTAPYVFLGIVLWVCVLISGVNATLAGVALAFSIPLEGPKGVRIIPKLEHGLHPYVTFAILPLFAFANAGLSLSGISLGNLADPLPLGIAAGLVVGKPLGIMLMVVTAVAFGLAKLPQGAGWRDMFGVSCLAGIGFTMSLFIGLLAYSDAFLISEVRLGVLVGSLISGIIGVGVLTLGKRG
ncbi:MAG: Na+/H+ antiporter NhaA [Aestuariivirgaceae bacterium]|nr:Na+/H+ antiporter NhaA [Aestuariivirgaceae bacterium]